MEIKLECQCQSVVVVVVVFQGCSAVYAANATILAGGVLSTDARGDRTLLLHFFFRFLHVLPYSPPLQTTVVVMCSCRR